MKRSLLVAVALVVAGCAARSFTVQQVQSFAGLHESVEALGYYPYHTPRDWIRPGDVIAYDTATALLDLFLRGQECFPEERLPRTTGEEAMWSFALSYAKNASGALDLVPVSDTSGWTAAASASVMDSLIITMTNARVEVLERQRLQDAVDAPDFPEICQRALAGNTVVVAQVLTPHTLSVRTRGDVEAAAKLRPFVAGSTSVGGVGTLNIDRPMSVGFRAFEVVANRGGAGWFVGPELDAGRLSNWVVRARTR